MEYKPIMGKPVVEKIVCLAKDNFLGIDIVTRSDVPTGELQLRSKRTGAVIGSLILFDGTQDER